MIYKLFYCLYIIFSHTLAWPDISSIESNGKKSNDSVRQQRQISYDSTTIKSSETEPPRQTKEIAPSFTFAAWDDNGQICILAKFEAVFTINYETKFGGQQLIAKLPQDVNVKGRCVSLLDDKPVMDISWRGGFTFRMVFAQHSSTKSWGVFAMDFVYNTKDSAFTGSINGQEVVTRTKDQSLVQFETELGKSYYCPSPDIISLYNKNGERSVILRITNVQLQAYQIKRGRFSQMSRCGQVGFGSGVIAPFYMVNYREDESISMIVGAITILVSLLTVAGYAVYRSWFFKSPEYNTMT